MKKPYLMLEADILLLRSTDPITTSIGLDHGMGGGVAPDQDWQIGTGNVKLL